MKAIEIPRRVDEPPHLLLWSADELAPMILGITIGVVIGKALICFLAGLLISGVYRRFRESRADGYLFHMIYWRGLSATRARTFRNPFARRYLP